MYMTVGVKSCELGIIYTLHVMDKDNKMTTEQFFNIKKDILFCIG